MAIATLLRLGFVALPLRRAGELWSTPTGEVAGTGQRTLQRTRF